MNLAILSKKNDDIPHFLEFAQTPLQIAQNYVQEATSGHFRRISDSEELSLNADWRFQFLSNLSTCSLVTGCFEIISTEVN